jgi:hypothetical protein
MWLEPRYFDPAIEPIGRRKVLIPERPDLPEEEILLDALLALGPAGNPGNLGNLQKVVCRTMTIIVNSHHGKSPEFP